MSTNYMNRMSDFLSCMITGQGRDAKETRKLNDLKRSNLRRLTMNCMKADNWDEEELVRHVKANPRVASGEISFSGTFSGARDMFTNVTMTAISLGLQTNFDTLSAITNPKKLGFDGQFGACASVVAPDGGEMDGAEWSLEFLKAIKDFNVFITKHVEVNTPETFADLCDADQPQPYVSLKGFVATYFCLCGIQDEDEYAAEVILRNTRFALASLQGIETTTTTTTTKRTSDVTNFEQYTVGIDALADGERAIVDAVLEKFNMPNTSGIEKSFSDLKKAAKAATNEPTGVKVEVNLVDAYNGNNQSGTLPDGKVIMTKAAPLFDITGRGARMFDFEVPSWSWNAPHPLVPDVDVNYQFDPSTLLRILMAIVKGDMTWIFGHTGTGKSTLVEQVCARLNYPMMRVNFDSEITRMDLVGRDTLRIDKSTGTTVTEFVEGILPQALQTPCVMLADELDAIRPDVAYVYQRVLEGNGMVLNEDGGKVIRPHPWFRLVATGNSRGNGDTSGMYNAVRPQSMAMLDRFGVWIEVDYMPEASLRKLLTTKHKLLPAEILNAICSYAKEHWTAFKGGDLRQPLSPRGILSVAEQYTFLSGLMTKEKALDVAVKMSVADRSEESDAQTIAGLLQRIVGNLN